MISSANKKVINSLFFEDGEKINTLHFEILEQEKGSDFYKSTMLRFDALLSKLEVNKRTANAVMYAYGSKNKELIAAFRKSCKIAFSKNIAFAIFYIKLSKDYNLFDSALSLVKNEDTLSAIILALPVAYIGRAIKVLQKSKHNLFFEIYFLRRDGLTKEEERICVDGITKQKLQEFTAANTNITIHVKYCDSVAEKFYAMNFSLNSLLKNASLTLSLCVQFLADLDRLGNKHRLRQQILLADADHAPLKTKVYLIVVLEKLGFLDDLKLIEVFANIK